VSPYFSLLKLEYEKKPKTGPQKIIEIVEQGPQDDSEGLPFGRDTGVLTDEDELWGGYEW
jgi:hypothetical protein